MKRIIMAVAFGAISVCLLSQPNTASANTVDTTKKVSKKTITVVVKQGDTLEQIAKKYRTTYPRLFNANKHIQNPDMIDIGDKIRIPAKKEKLKDRFAAFTQSKPAPAAQSSTVATAQYSATPRQSTTSTSYYVGNGMWCTDYVHSKRPDVPIYGNAGMSWISAARNAGKPTGTQPRAGAVAVTPGHVAYVERVNSDGTYVVSEMGWNYRAGNFNRRTVTPGTFQGFIY